MTPTELRALADALSRQRQADEHGIYCAVPRQAVDAAIKYLRAQADAQPVAPAVPAGWKLVPVEPTPEMLHAEVHGSDWNGRSGDERARAVWAAVLAAAPAAPHHAMLDSHRRLVEQAIQSAEHPSGMSTHDGKARIDASILRRMLAIIDSLPAAPQAEPKRDWSTIDAAIREYLDDYELIGEDDAGADACYTPTERELYLIYDAINGLLADESFVAAISAPQAEPKREPTCLWSRADDDDTDVWETSCGHAFTIIEGTPSDNHMEFCCYCGRRVDEEIGGSDE